MLRRPTVHGHRGFANPEKAPGIHDSPKTKAAVWPPENRAGSSTTMTRTNTAPERQPQILTDGGAASALSGLTTGYGQHWPRGNSSLLIDGVPLSGAGGASPTTTSSFTIYHSGGLYVDYDAGDGGSAATFGGALIAEGQPYIGKHRGKRKPLKRGRWRARPS
jgi:hypothetical protein